MPSSVSDRLGFEAVDGCGDGVVDADGEDVEPEFVEPDEDVVVGEVVDDEELLDELLEPELEMGKRTLRDTGGRILGLAIRRADAHKAGNRVNPCLFAVRQRPARRLCESAQCLAKTPAAQT